MMNFDRAKCFKGSFAVSPDKSITHRAFLLSAMSEGVSLISNPLISADTLSTIKAVKQLGATVEEVDSSFRVISQGFLNFKEPDDVIDCENSGTTSRLITGILACRNKYFVITGDPSLRKRPFDRIIKPLRQLGGFIAGRCNNKYLPLTIMPAKLKGSTIESEVHSAQVKSAILLAGLQTDEGLTYIEKIPTRNHTEIMLPLFDGKINCIEDKIIVEGNQTLRGASIYVPGDFSSAAFYIAAAIVFEESSITIKNCGLNNTRIAFLNVLEQMGVKFDIDYRCKNGEPYGDLHIEWSEISGVKVGAHLIPNLIDEIPVISMLGLFSKDPVEIRDAAELRIKESDRISALVKNFRSLGATVDEYEDGFTVHPLMEVKDKVILSSFGDHRIAMVNIILAKKFGKNILIDEIDSINVSNPVFLKQLEEIEVK
jgi:3-phosphoshikimate 1-carboxyvinyltransferase